MPIAPAYSGTSTTGAGSSPAVPIAPVYSGISTTGAASSPAVPIAPVYSGTSWTAASAPLTPPVNSGTSWTAGSVLPDTSFLVPTKTISSCAASTTSRSFSVRLPSTATSVRMRSLPSRPTWVTRVSPSGRFGSSCLIDLKLIASSTTSRLGSASWTAGSVLAVSTSSLVNWIRYSLTFLPLSETRRTKTGSISSPLSTTVAATFSPASTVTLGRFPL